MSCRSINFSFSGGQSVSFHQLMIINEDFIRSRSQYCELTGRPPLGSWSKMSSLSSVGFIERINGTEVRDLSRAAYRGRYTWVCMSTSSLRADMVV